MSPSTLHETYLKQAARGPKNQELKVGWRSPSNIALIKYWGKRSGQVPQNASLSFTLDRAVTDMRMTLIPERAGEDDLQLEFLFGGKAREDFAERIRTYLRSMFDYFPFLRRAEILLESSNTFPHSSGIASSASSFSALALCLCSLEAKIRDLPFDSADFLRKASYMARLGSGSAARSVFGKYVSWGHASSLEASSELYATPLQQAVDPVFQDLHDAVLIVSSQKKKTSSSAGHALMELHPYRNNRYEQAGQNLKALLQSLREGTSEDFIRICEMEALSLHALMLSSDPGFLLLEPETLEMVRRIRSHREKTGRFLTFTIDAGPNVHLIYPGQERESILEWVEDELLELCEDGKWLDDRMGEGPVPLPT